MDTPASATAEREGRFRSVYDAAYVDLLRFVSRRVHPTHAEDIVAEVMLVAWRRLEDLPADQGAARAWLFGVARKILQNTRRRENRQDAVAVRLAELRHSSGDAGLHPDLIACRVDVAGLAAADRLRAGSDHALRHRRAHRSRGVRGTGHLID